MFRIRIVPNDSTPANAASVRYVQDILREQFPGLGEADIESIPERLRDPLKYRFRPILMVAEDANDRMRGFALLLHAPDLHFCYLDFIATAPSRGGGGVGSALYERVREEALALGAVGVFFECLPDTPELSPDPEVRQQNADRLRFYERFGARPFANTAYETPVNEGDTDPPLLVFDGLGQEPLPPASQVAPIVRAILERKYGALCPPAYIDKVVESFRGPALELRPPHYQRRESPKKVRVVRRLADRIVLVVNDRHEIHHIRERGYVEAPVRVPAILRELDKTELFERIEPHRFPEATIEAVHDGRLVSYLRRACEQVGTARSVYPYVFPVRNAARPPKQLPLRAGYFCIDTFTPINGNAYLAARRAVDCALSAAERVVEGQRFAYALVRPPGHHAEGRSFGGFCYFNNAAVAANYLSRYGRVAVLDVDYHHGNGTQDIFYERSDVLTVSIHGHPSFAYPYFSGFRDEQGIGAGAGYNLNLPLPEQVTPEEYRVALEKALRRVRRFDPDFLIVAAGFDTAAGDPTGSWSNRAQDFHRMGHMIGAMNYPTLIVQEGGYRVRTLGTNARNFFEGLRQEAQVPPKAKKPRRATPRDTTGATTQWRTEVGDTDLDPVRLVTGSAGVFSPDEVSIAVELVQERLRLGAASGYEFLFAEQGGRVVGYTCFGEIPGTEARYDLYWLVVHPDVRRMGLGEELLRRTQSEVARHGGRRLFIDTSSAEAYRPARKLYRKCGFRQAALLPDFYRDGDGKTIFAKELSPDAAPT